MVVCLGDCCDMSAEDQVSAEGVATGEGHMSQVISCLENIKCKVVYVPGNVRSLHGDMSD
jgi:hypothetical protein